MDDTEDITAVMVTPKEQLYFQIMEDLNKPSGAGIDVGLTSRLHAKQIESLTGLYQNNKKLVMVPCGRKFGKTEVAAYALWRHALLYPGSACYYIAPEAAHGRKIIWDTQRLQKFLGNVDSNKYVLKVTDNTMRVIFKNGSFIQVMGSDNWAAANGLTPDIVVYDEFKVFNPKFHIEFDPNRAAKNAPLIIIGTQPKVGDKNKDQYEGMLDFCKSNSNESDLCVYTTFDNPINMRPENHKAIMQQIKILRDRGEEDTVQREYYSRIVPGGSRAIFPMLREDLHIFPHEQLLSEISKDLSRLEWYCVADPGSTTCFAGLTIALNPYTKVVYVLDELYEKDQSMTSTRMIYPRLESSMKTYYPSGDIIDDWYKCYDEAAAWFANEVMQQYGVYFSPTAKHINKKEEGLSLIKDQLIHNLVKISSNCIHLFKEMQEYAKDDNGNIPKKNDHLVDCFRYFNGMSHYNMHEVLDAIRLRSDGYDIEQGRHRRFGDDESDLDTWDSDIFSDF